jgi:hypothetical protein
VKSTLYLALAARSLASSAATAGTFADVHVINRSTGQRLPVYHHGGRMYVAGNPGDRYTVQIVNRSAARILSVVSVDGVNVVSGETASPNQTGYVLVPGQSYEITGWRKNQNEIAAFYFTSLPDSYAARTDRPQNVGVIGVAVFREWTPPRPRLPLHPRPFDGSSAPGAPSASQRAEAGDTQAGANASAPGRDAPATSAQEAERSSTPAARAQRERIGTGHGEREYSAVTYTDFRRASSAPNEVLTVYYDRYENLVARGIIPGAPHYAEPRPFPQTPPGVRFVPDPRG